MTTPTASLEQQRGLLAAAREALGVLSQVLYQAGNDDLGAIATELDAVASAAAGARAETVLETVRRGVHLEFGKSIREWVIEYCPSLRQAGAGQLAKTIDIVTTRTNITAGVDYEHEDAGVDLSSAEAIIWARVRTGEAGAPLAMTILNEADRLKDRITPEAMPTVTDSLLTIGIRFGPATMRELRIKILAAFGRPGKDEVEDEHDDLKKHAFFSSPQVESGGLTRYSLGLTPESTLR